MAGGRLKGAGRTHPPDFLALASDGTAGSAATIDARRAETRSGSAAPCAGERGPARRGGSRPKDRVSHVAGLQITALTVSVRFLMYLRQFHHGE